MNIIEWFINKLLNELCECVRCVNVWEVWMWIGLLYEVLYGAPPCCPVVLSFPVPVVDGDAFVDRFSRCSTSGRGWFCLLFFIRYQRSVIKSSLIIYSRMLHNKCLPSMISSLSLNIESSYWGGL